MIRQPALSNQNGSARFRWADRVITALFVALAAAALAILITALPGYAGQFGGKMSHSTPGGDSTYNALIGMLSGLASLFSASLSIGLALLFFRRRKTVPVAAALAFYLLAYGIVMAGPLEVWCAYWFDDGWLAPRLQGLLLAVASVLLLAIFPSGRFVPAWSRWLLPLAILWSAAYFLLPSLNSSSYGIAESALIAFLAVGLIALFAATLVAQVVRYRRISSPTEQQQTKWVVFGFSLWLLYVLLSSIPYFYLTALPPGSTTPWWGALSALGWFLALNIVPMSLAIAVARYRLLDIDVVINRTLVYGALTASVVGVYVLVVGAFSLLLQTQANGLVALIATGLIAVLFQPLRERLQRGANRLIYGDRDEPFEVMARLGQRLEDALAPDLVLATIVTTIAQSLKLSDVAIAIQQGDTLQTTAAFGRPANATRAYALSYQGAVIGQLLVAPRAPDAPFTAEEDRLLQNVARQAGAAVHALQLTADLQHARQQVVASREEERRRLRRDLHDGLGPSLAAQLLKLGSARALLAEKPEITDRLLSEMERDIENTLAEVRRIVYGLRPPALDQWGLVGALRAYAETCAGPALSMHVAAPETLPPLPAAVEVAAYHIAREALTNVVRHAQAHHCTVQLSVDGADNNRLHLVVRDNGKGMAANTRTGVGLTAMRERAEELGGALTVAGAPGAGTQVMAILPLHTGEELQTDHVR